MENRMAWHEDDNDNDSKQKGNNNQWNNNRNRNDDGLPDLDEYFQKGQKWLKQALNGGSGGGAFGEGGGSNKATGPLLGLSVVIIAFIIGIMGFYKVEPGEQAVEYRFGKYIATQGPGPHWIFPGIYTKEVRNTSAIMQRDFMEDLITKEVNIVSVVLAVQYKIGDLEDYLFRVRSPEESLSEATRSAIRQVIAELTLDEVLSTRGKSQESFLGRQIQLLIESNLKVYNAGLEVLGAEIRSVLPPEQVKAAFNDAIQAQEDEIRYKNEAEAYESKVIPVAQGKAARILQDANAYAAQTVLAAEGDVARFKQVLPEYKRAPEVTRNRLYLDAIEGVLKQTPKVIVDSKSNNMLLLPLEKMGLSNLANVADGTTSKSKQTDMVDEVAVYTENTGKNTASNMYRQPTRTMTRTSRD